MRRVVVGVLAWAVFALGWSLAARNGAHDSLAGGAVLLLSALAAFALALGWRAHNRGIYRRRGPRRSSGRPDASTWERDRLGQRLHFDEGLATATEVVVGSRAGVKTYRATT